MWDGILRAEALTRAEVATRSELADAAKNYDWVRVLEFLSGRLDLINSCRPGRKSLLAPLH